LMRISSRGSGMGRGISIRMPLWERKKSRFPPLWQAFLI